MTGSASPILVLSEEALSYRRLLEEDARVNAAVIACTDPNNLPDSSDEVQVVLGEPHLVSQAIPDLPKLRWIQSTWAGLTPLLAAADKGIEVTGVKDVFGAQMADYVFGYLLQRELQIEARKNHQQQRDWWTQGTGGLAGKKLGVMGTGSIGSHIARVGVALGMDVVGLSRSGRSVSPFREVMPLDSLAEFLSSLDAVVGVLPDTPETTDLLNRQALACLPDRAVVINVGRGNLIDEQALVSALESGEIAAAVLDVFKQEPLPPEHPFWTTPNLALTAHVAARSYPEDVAKIFTRNYVRFTTNQSLNYQLEPDRGY